MSAGIMSTKEATMPRETRKIAFSTLGCKLNQYETDSIASQFMNAGYRIVEFDEPADVYVINSCTVTNKADRKSRNLINRALRHAGLAGESGGRRERRHAEGDPGGHDPGGRRSSSNPAEHRPGGHTDSMVVVTGCFVNSHKDQLERDGRTFVVENDRKSHIFEMVDAHYRGEILQPESLTGNVFGYGPAEPVFHTRSMVKVQDGCDNFCTFCIIPYVRGRARSRPLDDILMDVAETVRRGYREVVLTGVNMSRYDDEGTGFGEMIERILELPGDFRLRISSLEPDSLDERFLRSLEHPKMCPHLHLCLQSGSERMLLRMRRQYTLAEYRQIVDRIRSRLPDFNLTTDIIVGFPGETEKDFAESCAVARDIGFSHIHTFKYSRREGTRAARMPDQISEPVKSERSAIIREISTENKRRYRRRHLGGTQRLLAERLDGNGACKRPDSDSNPRLLVHGYGEHYVPIAASVGEAKENHFYTVRITGISDDDEPVLIGKRCRRERGWS